MSLPHSIPPSPPPSSSLHNKRKAVLPTNLKRRKRSHFVDPAVILAAVSDENLSPASSPQDLYKALEWVKSFMAEAIAMDQPSSSLEKAKSKAMPSSTIEIADIKHLLAVHYSDEDPACLWSISDPVEEARKGTSWLDTVLNDIKSEDSWGLESCEALVRTIVDLILFDRLRLLEKSSRFYQLRVVGEYPITTKTNVDNLVINGRCDYVLGYGGSPGKKNLDSGLVAIEVKKRYSLPSASPQLISYLVGLQQQRKAAAKIVPFVYGIATDGVNFLFHRLDGNLKLQTASVPGLKKALIYRYLDVILECAIRATPHTSPMDKFPATSQGFADRIEKPFNFNEVMVARGIVEAGADMEYVIVADKNGHPCLEWLSDHEGDEEDETTGVE